MKLFLYKFFMRLFFRHFLFLFKIATNRKMRSWWNYSAKIVRYRNNILRVIAMDRVSITRSRRWPGNVEMRLLNIQCLVSDSRRTTIISTGILLANSYENNGASSMRFRRYTSGESMIEPDKCRPPSFGTFHGERPFRDTIRISKSRRTSLSVQFPGLLPVRRTTCRYTPSCMAGP